MRAVVITPTTGAPELEQAIQSVARQGDGVEHWVVVDGVQFAEKSIKIVQDNPQPHLRIIILPENTGMPYNHFWGELESGFYGHRIYASIAGLINAKYTLFLDQDNWFEDNHVRIMVEAIQRKNLEWCYSLRKAVDKDGSFICNDDCDSLGIFPNQSNIAFVDMNCYCFTTEFLLKLQHVFYRDTYHCDRELFKHALATSKSPESFAGTGKYTVNYRCGRDGQSQWFLDGNEKIKEIYPTFPWRSK